MTGHKPPTISGRELDIRQARKLFLISLQLEGESTETVRLYANLKRLAGVESAERTLTENTKRD